MNLKSVFKINLNIAGVDEVGRGSLIGPVYASAVILKKECDIKKLKDSKQLTKKKREILNKYIKKNSYWSIASASKKEIEKLNILNATLLAMQRAIKKLKKKPKIVLIDGNRIPKMKNYNLKYVIKGDEKIPEISAASIIAKQTRELEIEKLKMQIGDFGSGYPSDERTIKFLKSYFNDNSKWPSGTRKSWKTIERIRPVKKLSDFGD